jgi:hypothetical protein
VAAITAAVGAGELTPAEAGELFKLVDGFARLREATILEQQLASLKRAVEKSAPPINKICQVRSVRTTTGRSHEAGPAGRVEGVAKKIHTPAPRMRILFQETGDRAPRRGFSGHGRQQVSRLRREGNR